MNFTQALKHITGEKRKLKRARDWMQPFIKAWPAKERKSLQNWYAKEADLDKFAADLYRDSFVAWKKKEKSRSARNSRRHRKPRLPA